MTIGKNTCSDVGIYEFTMGSTGAKVKGRYSFVYVWEDDEWKINHHHSSVMPEGTMAQVCIVEPVYIDVLCVLNLLLTELTCRRVDTTDLHWITANQRRGSQESIPTLELCLGN